MLDVGAASVYVEGASGIGRDEWIRTALRPGDTLLIMRLMLLAEPRKRSRDNPRMDLWAVLAELRRRGVTVWELATDRRSDDPQQRDDMIRDAIEALTLGGRHLPSDVARAIGSRGGRPRKNLDPWREIIEREWYSNRHPSNKIAVAVMRSHGVPVKHIADVWRAMERWLGPGKGGSGRG